MQRFKFLPRTLVLMLSIVLFIAPATFAASNNAEQAQVQFNTGAAIALQLWYSQNHQAGVQTEGMRITLADGSGSIEGVVSGAEGGIEGAQVFCWTIGTQGIVSNSATTDASGYYKIENLDSGEYYVIASAGGYYPLFYDNAKSPMDAGMVDVTDGETTSDINFTLSAYNKGNASIAGTVTDKADNSPVAGTWILAFSMSNPFAFQNYFATTDENGNYQISGLPGGTYFLLAYANGYIPEIYDNATSLFSAKPVAVAPNAEVTGIDFALNKGGTISGHIADEDGGGIAGVKVTAMSNDSDFGNGMSFLAPILQIAVTDADGNYKIKGLKEGAYTVSAIMQAGASMMVKFYDDQTDPSNATPVQVAAGQDTPNIDFIFAMPTGAISGHLMDAEGNPLQGVHISVVGKMDSVFYNFGRLWNIGLVTTDAEGYYEVKNLAPGDYYVGAVIWDWFNSKIVWYDNVNSFGEATPVTVGDNETVTDIDFNMDVDNEFGSISGKIVSDDDGSPVAWAYVEAVPVNGRSWGPFKRPLPSMISFTDADGNYTLKLLRDGDYYVSVRKNGYREYYDDAADKDAATPVTVTGGKDTPDINFSIPPFPAEGSKISGVVTDASTDSPIAGAIVTIFPTIHHPEFNGNFRNWGRIFYTTTTDENGQYLLGGIPAGTYVASSWARDYIAEFYDNGTTPLDAEVIELDGTEEKSGIDFSLDPGWGFDFKMPTGGSSLGTISGIVKSDDGMNIEGAYVYAIDTDNNVVASERSGADGSYAMGGIEEGDYYVQASRSPYNTEYYPDASTESGASTVSVGTSDQWDVQSVDFILSPTEVTGVGGEKTEALPQKYELSQNYPNPFNPTTTIQYALPTASQVRLDIINIQGEVVKTLVNGHQTASSYKVVWDGTDSRGHQVTSGLYFYKLQAGDFTQVRRMVFMK
ncbi:MAG: T9SS type A sorting domain-containing protein [Actinobacteria bacterium]|nr:T9SS type A sorting domain-containing protein [Actinomycetota bacterium]